MGRPLRATIPHSLGKDEARRRIEAGAANLQQQVFGSWLNVVTFAPQWQGDKMEFSGGMLGQRMTGRMEIQADAVLVEVDLPEILAALADKIGGLMTKETAKLLQK